MELKNMDFFSKDNILILTADSEVKKGKKGDGVNSILGLLQEMRNFRDKIDACAEAQDITENRQKVEAVGDELDKHYEELIDLAKGGIKSIRNEPVPGMEAQEGVGTPAAPALPSTPTPISK